MSFTYVKLCHAWNSNIRPADDQLPTAARWLRLTRVGCIYWLVNLSIYSFVWTFRFGKFISSHSSHVDYKYYHSYVITYTSVLWSLVIGRSIDSTNMITFMTNVDNLTWNKPLNNLTINNKTSFSWKMVIENTQQYNLFIISISYTAYNFVSYIHFYGHLISTATCLYSIYM